MSSQKVRAQAVAALERAGRVTAAALVAAAKNKKHPLHNDFDWVDKTAGHKHRLQTAREIINSVRVIVTTSTHKIKSISYVRDPQCHGGDQGYIAVAVLRDDVEYARWALDAEVERVKSALDRARDFAVAVGLAAELQFALQSVMKLHSKATKVLKDHHEQAAA